MSLLHQLVIASLCAFAAAQCPGDFFDSGDICFSVIDTPGVNVTWDECRAACIVLGADIATFHTAEELETFSITWIDESSSYPDYAYMWVGLEKVDGNWETVDGISVGLQNLMWGEGHPHDMGIKAFLEDITMASGVDSYGRLYYSCSMGVYEHHSRCLCNIR